MKDHEEEEIAATRKSFPFSFFLFLSFSHIQILCIMWEKIERKRKRRTHPSAFMATQPRKRTQQYCDCVANAGMSSWHGASRLTASPITRGTRNERSGLPQSQENCPHIVWRIAAERWPEASHIHDQYRPRMCRQFFHFVLRSSTRLRLPTSGDLWSVDDNTKWLAFAFSYFLVPTNKYLYSLIFI